MEMLDVRDLPDTQVQWLQRVVEGLRRQRPQEKKRSEHIVFATHDSDVIGGEFKRANAYE